MLKSDTYEVINTFKSTDNKEITELVNQKISHIIQCENNQNYYIGGAIKND